MDQADLSYIFYNTKHTT